MAEIQEHQRPEEFYAQFIEITGSNGKALLFIGDEWGRQEGRSPTREERALASEIGTLLDKGAK